MTATESRDGGAATSPAGQGRDRRRRGRGFLPPLLRRRSRLPRDAEGSMTLLEHLAELRNRLIISLAAVALGAVVAFAFSDAIIDFLIEPYCDAIQGDEPFGECRLVQAEPLEGFSVKLRVSGYAGIVLASPILLWQVWRFVSPGLHRHEKRYAIPFLVASVTLFLLGAALAVFTMPRALEFLLEVGGDDFQPLLRAGPYLSFVSLMAVAFGIAFQIPIVIMTLLLLGVTQTRTLAQGRRYAIVGITIFAAVITPSADPISLAAMAVPMYVLYEACIWIGRALKK